MASKMSTGLDSSLCRICLSQNIAPTFASNGYQLARCRDCSHLFVVDRVSDGVLEVAYDAEYYAMRGCELQVGGKGYDDYLANIDKRLGACRERLNEVTRFAGKAGRLLDYGCAVGLFVKTAVDAGWSAKGYERSSWAANYGRAHFGLDITNSDGSVDPFGPGAFDVVTMWDVMEHLQHPREVMKLVSNWLVPGGVMAFNTVNSSSLGARLAGPNWHHIHPPHHLNFFSKRSLSGLLADFGFKIVWVKSFGLMFADRDNALAAKQGKLRLLESLVHFHWRLGPLITALNLLDEISVIAVKE